MGCRLRGLSGPMAPSVPPPARRPGACLPPGSEWGQGPLCLDPCAPPSGGLPPLGYAASSGGSPSCAPQSGLPPPQPPRWHGWGCAGPLRGPLPPRPFGLSIPCFDPRKPASQLPVGPLGGWCRPSGAVWLPSILARVII